MEWSHQFPASAKYWYHLSSTVHLLILWMTSFFSQFKLMSFPVIGQFDSVSWKSLHPLVVI
jgi:hypothetical protein